MTKKQECQCAEHFAGVIKVDGSADKIGVNFAVVCSKCGSVMCIGTPVANRVIDAVLESLRGMTKVACPTR